MRLIARYDCETAREKSQHASPARQGIPACITRSKACLGKEGSVGRKGVPFSFLQGEDWPSRKMRLPIVHSSHPGPFPTPQSHMSAYAQTPVQANLHLARLGWFFLRVARLSAQLAKRTILRASEPSKKQKEARYLVDASEKRVFSLHGLACGAFSLRRLAFGFRRAGPMVAGRFKSTTEGQSKSAGSS